MTRSLLRQLHGSDPFVAFVGAGASALPPSYLPTWTQFNDVLLECLGERVAAYSAQRQPTQQLVAAFRARRDVGSFSPDFQAQLMEDEIGGDYFRVWQSLDTDAYGPAHLALAELARQGRLAAVVTTNFDRLIETALDAAGRPFEVAYDDASFATLSPIDSDSPATLPILKIHGSLEYPASLVDTLKQRVVGRPESVMRSLRALLLAYPWLFLGFSGADFTYEPHYLGVLDAAADAKGFIFLAREGRPVADGVVRLAEAYGPERGTVVHGELEPWLSATFGLDLSRPFPSAPPDTAQERIALIRQRIAAWVETLGPIASVNILCSLLRSAGLDPEAFWLLRKTWKSYRAPEDTEGSAYHRYNFNFGRSLLEAGLIANPIALAEDASNLLEWKEGADQNAFEFLARAYKFGNLVAAGGFLASVLAYRGEVGKAVTLADHVTDEAAAAGNLVDVCDVALAGAALSDVIRLFDPTARHLNRCVAHAETIGDEPRRAMLLAQAARFLTYGGHFAKAEQALDEAERVGTRLGLGPVVLASQAARGRWLSDSETSDADAVQLLGHVLSVLHEHEDEPLVIRLDISRPDQEPTVLRSHNPQLCRVLLDLNRAAMFASDGDVMHSTLVELDELVDVGFFGYSPHLSLARAECLMYYGDENGRALVPDLIAEARRLGEATENPWPAAAADALEQRFAEASRRRSR